MTIRPQTWVKRGKKNRKWLVVNHLRLSDVELEAVALRQFITHIREQRGACVIVHCQNRVTHSNSVGYPQINLDKATHDSRNTAPDER